MAPLTLSIDDLPNEILLQILSPLPVSQLVPLARLSRRFHALTLRLLEHRLASAASLQGRELLLEAFHPATRLSEPPLHCTCLGTPGLLGSSLDSVVPPSISPTDGQRDDGDRDTTEPHGDGLVWRFREINNMYTHFRPHRRQPSRSTSRQTARPRHPAGDVPGSRTHPDTIAAENEAFSPSSAATSAAYTSLRGTAPPAHEPQRDPEPADTEVHASAQPQPGGSSTWRQTIVDPEERAARATFSEYLPPYTLVKQSVNLDAAELFGQIRAVTTLVAPGPWRGLFQAVNTVSDGVLRLWRDWLATASAREEQSAQTPTESDNDSKAQESVVTDATNYERVVWVNDGPQNVGVKLRVRQRQWSSRRSVLPLLVSKDEDLPVSYEIEYEEVLVRTRWLLLVTENIWKEQSEAMANSMNGKGRAVVMGMFR